MNTEEWIREFNVGNGNPLSWSQMNNLYAALVEREKEKDEALADAKEEAIKTEAFRKQFSDAMLLDFKILKEKHEEECDKLFLEAAHHEDEIVYVTLDAHGLTLHEAAVKGIEFTAKSACAAIAKLRLLPDERLKTIQILEGRICEQRKQIAHQIEAIKERNLAMDALHYVWCSGGCTCGVHRFTTVTKLTEEVVRAAELNTKRLRSWWEDRKARDARDAGPARAGDGDQGERGAGEAQA